MIIMTHTELTPILPSVAVHIDAEKKLENRVREKQQTNNVIKLLTMETCGNECDLDITRALSY